MPSSAQTVMLMGCATPWRRPASSTAPTMRASAVSGSSSRPKVRASRNITSESVEPSSDPKYAGAIISIRSRLSSG
ncbi:hypothetical protein D3C72_2167720 [compost metagenome]